MTRLLQHLFVVPEPIVAIGLCLKVTLVMTLARWVATLLRGSEAATRELLWRAAFVAVPVLMLVGAAGPRVPVALPLTIAAPAGGTHLPAWLPAIPARDLEAILRIGSTVWLVGALLAGARLAVGHVAAARLKRRAGAPVAAIGCEAVAAALHCELRSAPVVAPVTCGVLWPMVLLPPDTDAWSAARRRAVVLHELAHVARRDNLWRALAAVVAVVFWFDPQVAFALRRLRIESERACDDTVLRAGCGPLDYAEHLLAAAATPRGRDAHAACACAEVAGLEERVSAILEPRRPRASMGGAPALAVWLTWLAVLAPLAVLRTHL